MTYFLQTLRIAVKMPQFLWLLSVEIKTIDSKTV